MRRARRFLVPVAAIAAAVVPAAAPADATPAACASPCHIQASFYAYVAPVTEVANGGSVVWDSIDVSHPTAEQSQLRTGATCFGTTASPGDPSEAVTFALAGGGVTATSSAGTLPCTSAIALGDVGAVLPYQCLQHPNMQAALLVTA